MIGGRALIIAAWSGVFIYGYLNAMLGIVLPNLMDMLKLDKSQAGKFFMFISIGLLVSSIPAGLTMDYSGTKIVTCLGLLAVAAAFWGLGTIKSPRFLYALSFLLGLGGAMVIAGENTTISLANTGQREIASNLLNLFFGVGAFIAPFIVMPVLKTRGFSGVLKA
jgi:fucose permease